MLFEDKLYCRAETSLRGYFLNGFKRVFKMKKAIRKSRRRKRKVQVYEYSDLYTSCNYQDFTFHDFCQVIKVKLGIVEKIIQSKLPDYKLNPSNKISKNEWSRFRDFAIHRINQLIQREKYDKASRIKIPGHNNFISPIPSITMEYVGGNFYKLIYTGLKN